MAAGTQIQHGPYSEHLIRVARTELVDAMPAMPLGYFHDVAREGNCPKAEDSDGVARW